MAQVRATTRNEDAASQGSYPEVQCTTGPQLLRDKIREFLMTICILTVLVFWLLHSIHNSARPVGEGPRKLLAALLLVALFVELLQ